MIIIDTSVIIKWCVPEINQQEAEQLKISHIKEELTLCIPPITFFEVVNTLVISKKLSLESINKFLDLLKEMSLREEKFDFFDLQNIAAFMQKYTISCYDASYVYLAKKLNTMLVTADKKLFEKTKKSSLVKLL